MHVNLVVKALFAWHIIASWVEVIKSLCERIPMSAYGDMTLYASPDGQTYTWHPPLLSLFIAITVTAASVTVACVIVVVDAKCRTRSTRATTQARRKTSVHRVQSNQVDIVQMNPVIGNYGNAVSSHWRI